jgi:hypothetical protein
MPQERLDHPHANSNGWNRSNTCVDIGHLASVKMIVLTDVNKRREELSSHHLIPIIMTYVGVRTYLVASESSEAAVLLSEIQFMTDNPDSAIESIFVLDPSEAENIMKDGRKFERI